MTRTQDAIEEVVRDSKHPFHQVASRPNKPTKHRYERRKAKQFMQMGDWTDDSDVGAQASPT